MRNPRHHADTSLAGAHPQPCAIAVLDTLRYSWGVSGGSGSAPKAVSARGRALPPLRSGEAFSSLGVKPCPQRAYLSAGALRIPHQTSALVESAVLGWGVSGTSPRLRVRGWRTPLPLAFHMFMRLCSSALWAGGRCPQSGARRALHRSCPLAVLGGPSRPRSRWSRPATVAGATGERLSGGAPRSRAQTALARFAPPSVFLPLAPYGRSGFFEGLPLGGLQNQRHGCDHAVMILNPPPRGHPQKDCYAQPSAEASPPHQSPPTTQRALKKHKKP